MNKSSKDNDGAPPVKLRRIRIRKPGDLAALQKKMWLAVLSAQTILTLDDQVFSACNLIAGHRGNLEPEEISN